MPWGFSWHMPYCLQSWWFVNHSFNSTAICVTLSILLFLFHLISFRVSSYFLQSTLHCSCFILISFSPQSFSFISSTIVHLVHIYLIWLHSYYIVIQPYWQFHPVPSLEINDLRVSLDKFLILNTYSILETQIRWFYFSLSLYINQEIQHGVRSGIRTHPHIR